MQNLRPFQYEENFVLFGRLGTVGNNGSGSQLDCTIEHATRTIREAIGMDSSSLCILLAGNPGLRKFIETFVCLAFPPYSPFVIHYEEHESSTLLASLHEFLRNLLMLLCEVSDTTVAEWFGIYDTKYVVNLINLYWRNNEKAIAKLVSSCAKLNKRFMPGLRDLTKPLLDTIHHELEHLQFVLSGIKKGLKYEAPHTFTGNEDVADRSDKSRSFDRNMLFVDKDTVLLDALALLESIMQYMHEDYYADALSTEVSTSDGSLPLVSELTNAYYLLVHCHQYTISQRAPIYKLESVPDRHDVVFQRCLFYRCKMVALNLLMLTTKYNVHISPHGSADFCYNWLLVFTQMGGEEYEFSRDIIIDDLRDIDFTRHADEWNASAGTWLPSELEQIKTLVMGSGTYLPPETREDITKIKDITGVADETLIRKCLEAHNNDVANTIIDLVNRPSTTPAPVAPSTPTIAHNKVPPITDPRRLIAPNYEWSLEFLPKESKQAVLNYWDYVNREDIYNDDYDDYDELEEGVVPLNAKMISDQVLDSSDSEAAEKPTELPTRNTQETYHSTRGAGRLRTPEDRRKSIPNPPRGEENSNATRGGRGRRGPTRARRGNRGRQNYDRKRNAFSWNQGD